MSAGQTTSFYVQHAEAAVVFPFAVFQRTDLMPALVDIYRMQSAAEYAARLLNAGVAHVDPHAIVGCKVVAA
jgi:hypothetical protein